jgi:fimbrial isopeptide formation D2 family protein
MKNLYAGFLCLFLLSATCLKAQYVTIPDTNFVKYLTINHPQCMVGSQMDTTCQGIISLGYIDLDNKGIASLEGIQYFDNLQYLLCKYNTLTGLPAIPNTLKRLDCRTNKISVLPLLPQGLRELLCGENPLGNNFASINLPQGLEMLYCDNTLITSLPSLPPGLKSLDCSNNVLGAIVSNLNLPQTLTTLTCVENHLDSLPKLPAGLINLNCSYNFLSATLPNVQLPLGLKGFYCGSNSLSTLPDLPAGLQAFGCYTNQLDTSLSNVILPDSLIRFNCTSNQLSSLPLLPSTLIELQFAYNQITLLPALPKGLTDLMCNNNPGLSCLPFFSQVLQYIDYSSTAIQCIPPVSAIYSKPDFSTMPICNSTFNPNSCTISTISGNAFLDNNTNCISDAGDSAKPYVKVVLDSAGVVTAQHYTTSQGEFGFIAPIGGTYNLRIDTTNTPFIFSCPDTAVISPSLGNILFYNCKPGFDLATQNITHTSGQLFPGQLANFSIHTGDAGFTTFNNKFFNPCPSNVQATVKLILTGPADFNINITPTPTHISADTIEWQVANISTFQMPKVSVKTDTLATVGQSICFDVYISTTTPGDRDTTNNHFSTCYPVLNSYDPNMKEVTPINGLQAGDWLYYTIHFQNMGNAAAINIKVLDTLNANLDVSTFQLLESSHQNVTELNGNIVKFSFPNIQLIDSATDAEASKGFVQYRIKIKQNAPTGFVIPNTASIYFDFNPAVVTNTVISQHNLGSSINNIVASKEIVFTLLPNPAKGLVSISTDIKDFPAGLKVYNTLGALVYSSQLQSAKATIDIAALQAGIYYFNLQTPQGVGVKRLVVE